MIPYLEPFVKFRRLNLAYIEHDGSTELAEVFPLLETTVFGCRAGRAAALRAKEVELDKLTLALLTGLAHVDEWNKQLEEAGIENPIVSPILLPDYTRKVR